jgi:hypothetical protein
VHMHASNSVVPKQPPISQVPTNHEENNKSINRFSSLGFSTLSKTRSLRLR